MNKFKINDTVEHSEGFGVVHEVSENGLKYLIDNNTDFGWFKENELTFVDNSKDNNKIWPIILIKKAIQKSQRLKII